MKAGALKTMTGKGLLTAALVCFASFGVRAQELNKAEADRLKTYDEEISAANPMAAKAFLEDAGFTDRLKLAAPEKAAALLAKAQAVNDLEKLLDRPWRDSEVMELSRALAIRIDLDKPLEKVGIGAVPETLLPWMAKYKNYSAHKEELIKKAMRQYEMVYGADEVAGKDWWVLTTIRERNVYLAEKANGLLEGLIENETKTDKAYQDQLRGTPLFKYLDPSGRGRYERYLAQLAAAENAKARLSAPRLARIQDEPIEQQLYLLGSLFDKSNIKGTVNLERKVDGARQSRPGETLSFQNNQLLAGMLRTAIVGELKGSVAGNKVLKFYNSGAKLNVAIESCQGCYAKYEPSSGRIILDSEMIQQYLRVNDLTTEALLKDKAQIAALAKYASPIFVEEAAHQMQHAWAARANIYKPYVQEDEIEANSMQALYTVEKLKADPKFKAIFSRMRRSSTYADQRLKLAQSFSNNPDEFSRNVRQIYYYGLPSFDAASSRILSAISTELERRKGLDAAAQTEIENSGVELKDAMGMTVQELTDSAADIKTAALKKIQDDLLHNAVYTGRYESAADWPADMLVAMRTSQAPKAGTVPAL